MRPLKVTIVLGSLSVGGGQQVVYELIRKIDPAKVLIHVICYEGKVYTKNEQELEKICSCTYLDAGGRISLKTMKKVFSAINISKPDVVHAHLGGMAYAVPWALLYKKPLLITAHTKPAQAFIPFVLPGIRYGLAKRRMCIAAVSNENLELLREFFSINDDRLVCVNNGIDIERFYKEQHTGFSFINVARQDENKNQAQIIRCFARIRKECPTTKLILVGDGPCNSELKKQCRELGLEDAVLFTGMIPNAEDYYAISDVYVQASHREALPMSILEAMAAGLLVISSNVGGICDIVKGNGILFDDNDDEALIDAMKQMISTTGKEKERMQECSKEIVEKYSSTQMAIKYTDIYYNMKI